MQFKQHQGVFADELERVLTETDTSIRRLERLSGISRRTLENWIYGHTMRPRRVEPILQIASALHLPAGDTDRLLMSAGYPPLVELKEKHQSLPANLLADWQLAPNQLLGQKSAALPAQSNLPVTTTPFFGREGAIEELEVLLRRPDLRLITITGLGGSGKTRLALETARSLVARFDHGVYFIPLDNVDNAGGLWEAIINGLHIPPNGTNSRRQIVEKYLRDKQILLLLDNFEHLLPLTAAIGRLLSQSPRLNLIITSRQALDLQAEQLYPIDGLSYAEGQASPAYQLFIETARRRVPGYQPTEQEARGIVALCEAVDGLPLALELAATWSDVLNPMQILDHLQSNFHEVWHNAADRPPRQKNLWDLFDYSWQMLPKSEQEAAMRLSVLRGSFTSEMALSIAGCPPAVLKLLIQTSLIRRTTGSRLMIHPLVRQFLEMKALNAGYDIEELEIHFVNVILFWTSKQSRLLRESFVTVHFQNLHREWQHIERAWWLAAKYQCYDLLESCWDILFYFEARGTWGEGYNFFEATRKAIPATNRRMQARLDEAEALMAGRLFDMPRSIKMARRSLETLQELDIDWNQDEAGIYARVILHLADYAFDQSGVPEEKKQTLYNITSGYLDKFAALAIGQFEASRYCMEKDFQYATQTYQKQMQISGADTYIYQNLLCFLAISMKEEGRTSEARGYFNLALERGLELGIYPAVVTATYELRVLESDDVSMRECRDALEALALEMGSRRTVGRVAVINAIQYLNLGMANRALHLTRIGLSMVWNDMTYPERTRILSTIAQAFIAFGLIKTAPQLMTLVSPRFVETA